MKCLKKIKKGIAVACKQFTQQIHDTAKKHYQSLKIKKTTQSVKQSEVINYRKSFENTNIVDIKSIITEHQKTIRKSEKVGSNSSLYSNTERNESFLI